MCTYFVLNEWRRRIRIWKSNQIFILYSKVTWYNIPSYNCLLGGFLVSMCVCLMKILRSYIKCTLYIADCCKSFRFVNILLGILTKHKNMKMGLFKIITQECCLICANMCAFIFKVSSRFHINIYIHVYPRRQYCKVKSLWIRPYNGHNIIASSDYL